MRRLLYLAALIVLVGAVAYFAVRPAGGHSSAGSGYPSTQCQPPPTNVEVNVSSSC